MNTSLDHSLLEAALEGLVLKHERVIAQIAEVRRHLGPSLPALMPASAAEPNSKRTISAAGRRAIAEAQRKRWAAKKEEEAEVEPKPKRKLSAAGRRAIVEATRKRWAAVREAKAKAAGQDSGEDSGEDSRREEDCEESCGEEVRQDRLQAPH